MASPNNLRLLDSDLRELSHVRVASGYSTGPQSESGPYCVSHSHSHSCAGPESDSGSSNATFSVAVAGFVALVAHRHCHDYVAPVATAHLPDSGKAGAGSGHGGNQGRFVGYGQGAV